MIGAGKRAQRVTFQQRGLDENGDRLGDWEDGFSRWARVRHLHGGEPVMQQRLQGVQPVEVTVLKDASMSTVTNAWRLVHGETPFNIRAVTPGERGREIVFLAESDGSDG